MTPLVTFCSTCGTEVPTRRPSLAAVEDVVVEAVTKHPGIGLRELRRVLAGMGAGVGHATAQRCLNAVVADGRVLRFTTAQRTTRHYVAEAVGGAA